MVVDGKVKKISGKNFQSENIFFFKIDAWVFAYVLGKKNIGMDAKPERSTSISNLSCAT